MTDHVINRPDVVQDVHLVPKSGNAKTGALPVTYRPMSTCPTGCPFLPGGAYGGCYGTGRLFASARLRSGALDVETGVWRVRLGRDAAARYLRDRVVGDIVIPNGTPDGEIDRAYLAGIAEIATVNGLVPFGYTHAWRLFTPADVAWLAGIGYVMNASTETVAQAERAAAVGLPVTIVDEDLPEGADVAGRRLVTCPAQTRDDVTCATCGLCAKADRSCVIRFLPHGAAKARARHAIAAARRADTPS